MNKQFNVYEFELKGNTSIIEASAGTGKTYSISVIFLRLILELGYRADDILAVTFTDAAASELRRKIKDKIYEVYSYLKGGELKDVNLKRYIDKFNSFEIIENIKDVLNNFDQAAIYTIHGFCTSVIDEFPFETAVLNKLELNEELNNLKFKLACDFFRKHMYTCTYNQFKHLGINPDVLLMLSGSESPQVKAYPENFEEDLVKLEDEYYIQFNKLRNIWNDCREKIINLLNNDKSLNRNKYSSSFVSKAVLYLDNIFLNNDNFELLSADYEKLSASLLNGSAKKNTFFPGHIFFEQFEETFIYSNTLKLEYKKYESYLKAKFCRELYEKLKTMNKNSGKMSFNDIISIVHDAVGRSKELCNKLSAKYKAVLIDEFQDTDSFQYQIFKNAFKNKSILYLIGDVKQSIYKFRNSDINTYLNARNESDEIYGMMTSYRSSLQLTNGINYIFGLKPDPFLTGIDFINSSAAKGDSILNIEDTKPFNIKYFKSESDKALSKDKAEKLCIKQCCLDVSKLLNSKNTINGKTIEPSDIAILVREKRQGIEISNMLKAYGIKTSETMNKSVFESIEAEEILYFMKGIVNYKDDNIMQSAALTPLCGYKNSSITDEIKLEIYDTFARLNNLWYSSNFISVFNKNVSETDLKLRLKSLPAFERKYTNYNHLAEIISGLEKDCSSPSEIIRKFEKLKNSSRDEYEQRIESDKSAVLIVTTHKSKGLEYDIVFAPFLWSGYRQAKEKSDYRDPETGEKIIDFGSENFEDNLNKTNIEDLKEDARLLYVALTRAKEVLFVYLGAVASLERSYISRMLISESGNISSSGIVGDFENSDEFIINKLNILSAKNPDIFNIQEFDEDSEMHKINTSNDASHNYEMPQLFSRYKNYSVLSYSGISFEPEEHAADDDCDNEIFETDYDTIFSFPKGAEAGNFMHNIFECIKFSWCENEIKELVTEKLAAYSYESKWADIITEMVVNVLQNPIEKFDLRLADLKNYTPELEFKFKCEHVNINDLLGAAGYKSNLNKYINGYIKGFIDLLFEYDGKYYILDWKSNHLGFDTSDYEQKNLEESMYDSGYRLQYHIYAYAVDKYLNQFLHGYDFKKHFGGIIYAYLRGYDAESGGFFTDIPDYDKIIQLRQIFEGGQN